MSGNEWEIGPVTRYEKAEAKLAEIRAEIERRAEERLRTRDERRGKDTSLAGEKTLARIDGEAHGLRAAAELLAEKS